MPFTIAHAAAAIPCSRLTSLPLPALIVGTMVPDLPMFLRAGPSYATTHSLQSAIPVGVMLGALCLLAFEWSKAPAVALLPEKIQQRLAAHTTPMLARDVRQLAAQIVAVSVGVLTHIVWDAFTHEDQWGTALIGGDALWVSTNALSLPGYKLMQYLSSLAGVILVGGSAWRWTLHQAVRGKPQHTFSAATRGALLVILLVVVPLGVGVYSARARTGFAAMAYDWITLTVALDGGIVLLSRFLLRSSSISSAT